jgi:hypothetical protein
MRSVQANCGEKQQGNQRDTMCKFPAREGDMGHLSVMKLRWHNSQGIDFEGLHKSIEDLGFLRHAFKRCSGMTLFVFGNEQFGFWLKIQIQRIQEYMKDSRVYERCTRSIPKIPQNSNERNQRTKQRDKYPMVMVRKTQYCHGISTSKLGLQI